MELNAIIKALQEHSISFKIENGAILAKEEFINVRTNESGFNWVDLTNASKEELFIFLGY